MNTKWLPNMFCCGKKEKIIEELVDYILNYKIKFYFCNIGFDKNKPVQCKENCQLMVKFSNTATGYWGCLCETIRPT